MARTFKGLEAKDLFIALSEQGEPVLWRKGAFEAVPTFKKLDKMAYTNSGHFNAVSLADGKLCHFKDEAPVAQLW